MKELKEVMKKYLPFFLLTLGLGVLITSFFIIRAKKSPVDEEEAVAEIPFEKRPFVSLIPDEEGHWLKLRIEKLIFEASSLDYELLYKVPDGRTQGVPGTIKLTGQKEIERDLLLGSESSGKFRYDEDVETGTLTLRFRDEKGKLMGKLSTDFHLQKRVKVVGSVDQKFSFTFDDEPKRGFFVTMETFGVPDGLSNIIAGPFAVFSSNQGPQPGKVDFKESGIINFWDGSSWQELNLGKSEDIGLFALTASE